MNTTDNIGHLIVISVLVFLSFVFAIIAVASDGWSSALPVPLLNHYNSRAPGVEQRAHLWIVGCVVLTILGILCLCISAIILLARFFNHGKGRAALGGVLSIFAGVMFLVTQIIFMVQQRPQDVYYGYSFALEWVAIPFAWFGGGAFFALKDSEFLK
ncbi:uncharacterized protein LOC143448226 [Clavelina lepadiformis]|uniref:uncharacterized protein LOC143448226 n=1 Tax=Clavelina lepadiformis TaxID=159417 RepID=UPI0040417770